MISLYCLKIGQKPVDNEPECRFDDEHLELAKTIYDVRTQVSAPNEVVYLMKDDVELEVYRMD